MAKVSQALLRAFPHKPTQGQSELFDLFDDFLDNSKTRDEKKTMLIKGYAGTGKTSVITSLVKVLPMFNYRFVLMAPTGRAAKVMSNYSRRRAFTIHKIIYKLTSDPDTGDLKFKKQKNYSVRTVFIVDEASMIGDEASNGARGLLHDLSKFVFADKSNRLVLIGDSAQLPPVKLNHSPALDNEYLQRSFDMDLMDIQLTEVVRQAEESGILHNATHLREEMVQLSPHVKMSTSGFKDVYRMRSNKLEDGLVYAYEKFGVENACIICRSNREAVRYNQYIRAKIHEYHEELETGDNLMIVRNNYSWLDEDSVAGFLANGDFVKIKSILDFEEKHGLRFAWLELKLLDYDSHPPVEAAVILDTLHSNAPCLSAEEARNLYYSVCDEHAGISDKKARKKAIQEDPYLNALQVKYAYALTCHKAQGGQWDAVFVDQGFLTMDRVDEDFYRWFYTAITRAKEELFLLNFNDIFFN